MKTDKSFQINIPISKIDEEQRIVTGIATTEAFDSQGDIVDYEASKKAFGEWRGNIREMHDPIAIGKAIDVQFDDENKQVVVSAKISESADGENSWIKVKEGILAGFSIGGRALEVAKETIKSGNIEQTATRIKDYVLSELSLVDNPANPQAMLMMVKSFDGKLQRVEAEVEPNNKLPDSWWMDKFMPLKEIKKSVYDAQTAISVAVELAYLIMSESWEEEQDAEQLSLLQQAFKAIQEFTAKEVVEDDTYLGEFSEVIELGRKAIDLRKGAIMAKEDKLEKTNVVGGEERDHNAEVTQTQEEAGRPDNDTTERAEEAGKAPLGTEEKVTVATEGEETEESEEESETQEESKKKADTITDLAKNVETLLAKLGDNQEGMELKKVSDSFAKLNDKVEKAFTSLEGRIDALEKQPLPTKAKSSYTVITKGESEVTNDRAAVLKRQEELIANPFDAKPGEAEAIAKALRTAPQPLEVK